MRFQKHRYTFKIAIIGDANVGKSAIMNRFVADEFVEEYKATIGIDFSIKSIQFMDGKNAKVFIWDTAGQERFRSIVTSFYRGVHAIIVCYDITCRQSFNNLMNWINKVKMYANDDTIFILSGNKSDLNRSREVSYEEGLTFARNMGISFSETSARYNSDRNINALFMKVIRMIRQHIDSTRPNEEDNEVITISTVRQNKSSCC